MDDKQSADQIGSSAEAQREAGADAARRIGLLA
jgi:hypothetical protein